MDEFVWVTLSDEYGDAGVYCGIWICENISFDEDSIIQNASELPRLDDQPQKHGYQDVGLNAKRSERKWSVPNIFLPTNVA